MSEETTLQSEATGDEARQSAAAATVRRRAPKQDATLAQAVGLARQAVVESAGADNVGEHVGIDVHEDRLLTHLFACTMAGYPGWTWFATVARAPRTKLVTVCEVGLLAGEKSLLAPEWVPWEERMQAVNEQNHDEGKADKDPQGEHETATSSESSGSDDASETSDSETHTAEADAEPATNGGTPDRKEAPESGTDNQNEASS